MNSESKNHASEIHAWISRVSVGLTAAQRLAFFTQTFNGLLKRVEPVLGPVVLTAILKRILYDNSQRYPFLSSLKLELSGTAFAPFTKSALPISKDELVNAFEAALTAFFTIIDRLSGEILTPTIYAALPQKFIPGFREPKQMEKS